MFCFTKQPRHRALLADVALTASYVVCFANLVGCSALYAGFWRCMVQHSLNLNALVIFIAKI